MITPYVCAVLRLQLSTLTKRLRRRVTRKKTKLHQLVGHRHTDESYSRWWRSPDWRFLSPNWRNFHLIDCWSENFVASTFSQPHSRNQNKQFHFVSKSQKEAEWISFYHIRRKRIHFWSKVKCILQIEKQLNNSGGYWNWKFVPFSGRASFQKLGLQGLQNTPKKGNIHVLLHFYVTISEI